VLQLGWQSSVTAGLAEQCYSWAGRAVLQLGWQSSVTTGLAERSGVTAGRVASGGMGWQFSGQSLELTGVAVYVRTGVELGCRLYEDWGYILCEDWVAGYVSTGLQVM
jgi:hypothetical protein